MNKNSERNKLDNIIGKKEARKIRAREDNERNSIWFGLGMFGLVGWSVAVPTLIFIAIGILIDSSTGSQYSWTLMMLFAGVILGCLNAWYWVSKESKKN
jgi:ATP synthase protein I